MLLDGLDADPAKAVMDLKSVVDKIQVALDECYVFGKIVHHGSASIGVNLVASGGATDPDQILKEADAEMYSVKKAMGSRRDD